MSVGITLVFLPLLEFLLVDTDPLLAEIFIIGIIHCLLCLHYYSHKIVCPLHIVSRPIFVKFAVHPASHNLVTDISKCNAKPSILCAHRNLSGS